ncbi:hypothetical protein GCM10011588_56610 [Nocardia jinanensis]|uniref:Uncharacterized protein n=1 Tax=Nocardia jinanensis TaxID=382504 RepID=A0A917RW04_9NOCA|nr:hypothetical protein GCM10011588_56610 [Nocardia jinanensis]
MRAQPTAGKGDRHVGDSEPYGDQGTVVRRERDRYQRWFRQRMKRAVRTRLDVAAGRSGTVIGEDLFADADPAARREFGR